MTSLDYKVKVINHHGGEGRRYCIFSGSRLEDSNSLVIEGRGIQESEIKRLACYISDSTSNNGMQSFSLQKKYFGFIGKINKNSGTPSVEMNKWVEVKVGTSTNDGDKLNAKILPRRGADIGLLDSNKGSGSDEGTFTICCTSRDEAQSDYVVGLAQMVDGDSVAIAAAGYVYKAEYKIRPGAQFFIRCQDGNVGDILRNFSDSFPLRIRSNRDLKLTENHMGAFSDNSDVDSWQTREAGSASGGGSSTQPPLSTRRPETEPPHTGVPSSTDASKPTPSSDPSLPHPDASTVDDEYALLSSYDTVFLIDDSGSMLGQSWIEVRDALKIIARICTSHDSDGIDIYFLNHRSKHPKNQVLGRASGGYINVTSESKVYEIFDAVRPNGGTPTGRRLGQIFKEYMDTYQQSKDRDEIKPLNIIVITDGAPSDDVKAHLVPTARKLDRLEASPDQIGVQFFQVGNLPGATKALQKLHDEICKEGIRDMVDTVTWNSNVGGRPVLKAGRILRAVIGAIDRRQAQMQEDDGNP